MADGRIHVETTNLETGERWSRVLEPDEWAIIYGPELELVRVEEPMLRRGARIVLLEKPERRRKAS